MKSTRTMSCNNRLKINTIVQRRSSFTGVDYNLKTPTSAFPSANVAMNQPAKTDSMKFSRFVCSVVYQTLGRFDTEYSQSAESPLLYGETSSSLTNMTADDVEFARSFHIATVLIHRVLKSTCHVIPLTMVVYALKLIDNIVSSGKRIPAKGSEPHFFAISLMLAQKMNDDHSYTNRTWAKIMGVSPLQVSFIEREFIDCLDFNLKVTSEEYSQWFLNIQSKARHWESVQSKRNQLHFVSNKPVINSLKAGQNSTSTRTMLPPTPTSPEQSIAQCKGTSQRQFPLVKQGSSMVMKSTFMNARSKPY